MKKDGPSHDESASEKRRPGRDLVKRMVPTTTVCPRKGRPGTDLVEKMVQATTGLPAKRTSWYGFGETNGPSHDESAREKDVLALN